MTKEELRAKLEPIMIDQTLTKQERSDKCLPIAKELMDTASGMEPAEVFELWNATMVDIVTAHNLGRH